MAASSYETAEQLLKLARRQALEDLARLGTEMPSLAAALTRLLHEHGGAATVREQGRWVRQIIEWAVLSLAPPPPKRDWAADPALERSFVLLNSFYLHRSNRRDTLRQLAMSGGSYDRVKRQALLHFSDALERVCAQIINGTWIGDSAPGAVAKPAGGMLPAANSWFIPASRRGANLPARPYRELWGREREQAEILAFLGGAPEPRVLAISGLGGNGKTALARQVAERALEEANYTDVLWVSAQQRVMVGAHSRPAGRGPFDLVQLLDDVLAQLRLAEWIRLDLDQKQAMLTGLWRTRPYLVVLDNLDETPDPLEIVRQFYAMLGRSHLIVTTRHSDVDELAFVHPFHLGGLAPEVAIRYLQAEAAFRGVDLSSAPRDLLLQVHASTGGAPLALNLVIGQAQTLALETVLEGLGHARAQMQDLYTYLFWQDWQRLDESAQKVLIYLGRMIPTLISQAQLQQVKLVPELAPALDRLARLSLVETTPGLTGEEKKFGLHPLVRQFVQSELPRLWRSQSG